MGKIIEIQVLQQLKAELSQIKKGSIFRVVTDEGGEGVARLEESPWQVALEDAVKGEEGIKLRSEQLHMIVGRPDPVEFSLKGTKLEKIGLLPPQETSPSQDSPKH